MPIIDIIIAVALLISIIVGFVRGFIKEAISIATLVVAIWASLYFGPQVGEVMGGWIGSEGLRIWFGRILTFAILLSLGGLLGWGLSKLVRLSVLSGVDRLFGSLFGAGRGVVLVALAVMLGQAGEFDQDEWWLESNFLPHFVAVADWIKEMAPHGFDLIVPDAPAEELPVELPKEL
ncbi:MAG: CvpA family protein [Pseudomonadota bacterium]